MLLSVVAVCLLGQALALDPHQLELKQHYEHLAYIADFPCLHPQPKVIPVSKLFSESQSHGKAYFPDVTVLHRCDECTGSCTSGHKCAGKVTELVLLPFKATYLHDTEKHKAGSWAMEYHELLNHTVCGCAVPPPSESCHSDADHKPSSLRPSQSSSSGGQYNSGSGSGSSNNYESSSNTGSGSSSNSGSGNSGSSGSSFNSGSGNSGSSSNSGSSFNSGSGNSNAEGSSNNFESSSSSSNQESSGSNSEVTPGSGSTTEDYLNALFERSKTQ